jgi:hypothetical protein
VFNTENVPSLAKLKEKRKIKSANISDESVINKITGDSYLVVIKVENVMTFKTSVFNYDSLIHLNADTRQDNGYFRRCENWRIKR